MQLCERRAMDTAEEDPFFNFGMEEWLQEDQEVTENNAENLCDDDIDKFIEEHRAANTVRKTRSDLNVWYRWCESINEKRKMEKVPTEELNRLLMHFFHKIKKA